MWDLLVKETMSYRVHTLRGFGRPFETDVWRENLEDYLRGLLEIIFLIPP
jgi:hypothetical protein